MEKRHEIREEQMIDLISGLTERIASGYDPEELMQLEETQLRAAKYCLTYIYKWSEGLLSKMRRAEESTAVQYATVSAFFTKMCEGADCTSTNKAILSQVQRLRGMPEDPILGGKK